MLALGLGSSGQPPLCRDWACLRAVLCWYDSKFSDWQIAVVVVRSDVASRQHLEGIRLLDQPAEKAKWDKALYRCGQIALAISALFIIR